MDHTDSCPCGKNHGTPTEPTQFAFMHLTIDQEVDKTIVMANNGTDHFGLDIHGHKVNLEFLEAKEAARLVDPEGVISYAPRYDLPMDDPPGH